MCTPEGSAFMASAEANADAKPVDRDKLPKSGDEQLSKRKPSLVGIVLLLLSGFLFTTAALFAKLLTGIPAIEIAQARCVVQLSLVLPLVLYYVEGSPLGPRDQLLWMIARGVFGVSSSMSAFYAIKHMPIGDATVLIFTSPVFTGIISRLFLKEPWGLWEAGASLLSITGVVFIARPSFLFGRGIRGSGNGSLPQQASHNTDINIANNTEWDKDGTNPRAVVMALTASVCMACALVVGRKGLKKVHFLVMTQYYGAVGLALTAIIVVATQEFVFPSSFHDGAFLLLVGGFGCLSQLALNKGLTVEWAVVGALIRNMDVVVAFVYQVTVFGDSVTGWSALGTFFILAGTLSITLKRYREQSRTGK